MATKKQPPNPDRHDDGGLGVIERPRVADPKTKKPRRFCVVFHNDDYTTMEFVVHVIQKFFHKGESEAHVIMLHVHRRGYGVVGTYTKDVAETKAARVMDYAKEHGHPLKVTAEPEGFDEDDDDR